MIKDLNSIRGEQMSSYDLCIVGTGPAGITLCAELADSHLRICLLESGGLTKSSRGDELRHVVSEGIIIKDHSRERVLGGTSLTWTGLSAPLDSIDMAERPFLTVPGWPISYEELRPYWKIAAQRYRFPADMVFENFSKLRVNGALQPQWSVLSEKIFLAASEPQDFAKEFNSFMQKKNIDFFYNATVIRLERNNDDNVQNAIVVSAEGEEYKVSARTFVLATGGIENARLLLSSDLGNESDQVGRYFMNHPKSHYGIIKLKDPVGDAPYFFGCISGGYAGYAGLRLQEKVQMQSGVLNSYIRLEPLFPWSGNKGVESAIFLFKKTKRLMSLWRSRLKGVTSLRDYAETGDDSPLQNDKKTWFDWFVLVGTILLNLPTVLSYAQARLSNKRVRIKKVRIRNFMEMEPRSENRITLSDEKDMYGQYIPKVHYETSELDRRSLIELHRTLVKEIQSNDLGELEGKLWEEIDWPIREDASHHMGSTRMGKDPQTSVVDKDLRIHTVKNVYCAGSSVFPTSGCANPTFTICALSIRLADHLKERYL